MQVLGIDIGGSGIKGAMVDVAAGALLTPRERLATPDPATPEAVAATVAALAGHFAWRGPVGCGFPAVVKAGVVCTAANISPRWLGVDGAALIGAALGGPVHLLNDADAAGLAELRFGAGRGRDGLVLMLTVGTGLGTALFMDGRLVPNSELGHIEIRGKDAELRASDAARRRRRQSWAEWARRLDEYLARVSALIWPDLIIIGGGVSRSYEKFAPLLTVRAELLPAQLRNEAGIIGAALAAAAIDR